MLHDVLSEIEKNQAEEYLVPNAQSRPDISNRRPWPRFFARAIDYTLLSTIFILITQREAGFIDGLTIQALSMPIEALLLALFGTTIGKWLLRIEIRDINNNKPLFLNALKRSFYVFVYGCGLDIPVINLFFLGSSHNQLIDYGATKWDKDS